MKNKNKPVDFDHFEKPLSEWTLGEVTEYCNEACCDGCFLTNICHFLPGDWDLTPKPRFTAEEIADAKAIERLFLDVDWIERSPEGVLFLVDDCHGIEGGINKRLFPSIRPGQRVRLLDIIGEEQ